MFVYREGVGCTAVWYPLLIQSWSQLLFEKGSLLVFVYREGVGCMVIKLLMSILWVHRPQLRSAYIVQFILYPPTRSCDDLHMYKDHSYVSRDSFGYKRTLTPTTPEMVFVHSILHVETKYVSVSRLL